MGTQNKDHPFASNSESWAFTSGGKATGAWQSSGGNPSGCLNVDSTGRNNSDTSYWKLTGITWEDLGVPAGSTVTNCQLDYDHSCTAFNIVSSASRGPAELRDSSQTLQATFSSSQSITGTSSWATQTGSNVAVPSAIQASNSSIELWFTIAITNGNDKAAQLTELIDNIDLVITYTAAAQQFQPDVATGSGQAYDAGITASGSVSFAPDLASGTGQAFDGSIVASGSVSFAPDVATGTGQAYDPTIELVSQGDISWTELTQGSSVTNGDSTAEITPTANAQVFLTIGMSLVGGFTAGNETFAVTGCGIASWTEVGRIAWGFRRLLVVLRGTTASPTTDTLDITVGNLGGTFEQIKWSVDECTGVDSGTPTGTSYKTGGAASATSISQAVSETPDSGDHVFYVLGVESNTTITPNSETETTLSLIQDDTGNRSFLVGYDSTPDSTPAPGASWTPSSYCGIIAFIINKGSGSQSFAPDTAVGTGQSYDATISASGSAPFAPAVATGTGQAFDAGIAASGSVSFIPDVATGTGQAYDATLELGPAIFAPDVAVGTGQAYDVNITASGSVSFSPDVATGTGQAYDATIASLGTIFAPDTATGTGQAYDTTITASGSVSFTPDVASGTGQAYSPAITASGAATITPETATGTGQAYDVQLTQGGMTFAPDVAVGTGDAYDVQITGTGSVAFTPETATGTGQAYDVVIAEPGASVPVGGGGIARYVGMVPFERSRPTVGLRIDLGGEASIYFIVSSEGELTVTRTQPRAIVASGAGIVRANYGCAGSLNVIRTISGTDTAVALMLGIEGDLWITAGLEQISQDEMELVALQLTE